MSLKVELTPGAMTDIWVLERQPTFEQYYTRYGDEIAERYERGTVIVVPFLPIQCDLEFLQSVTFPKSMKKAGVVNGLDRDLLTRNADEVGWNPQHVLNQALGAGPKTLYLYDQIVHVNQQVRIGLRQLFPRYFGLKELNLTWRFTQTENEVMHYDGYPSQGLNKAMHWLRIKFFINVDSLPRVWRVSHHLSHVLTTCFDPRLDPMPTDINTVNTLIGTTDVLFKEPAHRIEWPAMAAVFANGDATAHEVVFGRRAIGGDFAVPTQEMLLPEHQLERQLPKWLDARERARQGLQFS